jgi:hypothetical protein
MPSYHQVDRVGGFVAGRVAGFVPAGGDAGFVFGAAGWPGWTDGVGGAGLGGVGGVGCAAGVVGIVAGFGAVGVGLTACGVGCGNGMALRRAMIWSRILRNSGIAGKGLYMSVSAWARALTCSSSSGLRR